MIKRKYLIILIIILLSLNIKTVAAEPDMQTSGDGSAPGIWSGSSSGDSSGGGKPSAGTTCSCNPSYSWTVKSSLNADVYDEYGQKIGNAIRGIDKIFTAGRFIGLDVYEEYTKTINVNVAPTCCSSTITCSYYDSTCREGTGIPATEETKILVGFSWITIPPSAGVPCVPVGRRTTTRDSGSCGGGESFVSLNSTGCSANPGMVNGCLTTFTPSDIYMEDIDPSFKATYYNSNDINKPNENKTTIDTPSIEKGYMEPDPNKKNNGATGTVSRTLVYKIKYNLKKSCIDVKTGLVQYRNSCNDNEIETHILSKDGNDDIGKYFIPLNGKTNNIFSFLLDANDLRNSGLCIDAINKYTYWRNFIRDKNGNSFENVSNEDAITKLTNDGYCKYGIIGNFKINQKFYNENNSNMIEGYGVYFRPIDINNPFPNGLSSNSLWNGFYNATSKKVENVKDAIGNNIDLKKSFNSNELNYKIYLTNKKIKNIKKFNASEEESKGIYTSWEAMRKNGTSSFITTGRFDILNRITQNNKYNFYKLGCGPLNANWEECK